MVSGECLPLLDVFETERTIEIVLDVPGVTADSMRILIKSGVVLVAGEKERAEPARGPASFHLVERDFGRFARAVRVHAAIDASQARARLKDGELRIMPAEDSGAARTRDADDDRDRRRRPSGQA